MYGTLLRLFRFVILYNLFYASLTSFLYIVYTIELPIIENPNIYEKNITEHMHMSDMTIRINEFVNWLLSRSEQSIVVVGHSAFFRDMISSECKMANCEVRKYSLTHNGDFIYCETLFSGGRCLLENNNEVEGKDDYD
jgi:hypothetical protein